LFSLPLALIGGWMIFSSIERFIEMFDGGDMNGDGTFTISDLPEHILDILLAPGETYQGIFATNKIGLFLEMSANDPNIFWSLILTGFSYLLLYWGLSGVFITKD
jgi:hypothetical protein